jgi:Radical SAM superfamily
MDQARQDRARRAPPARARAGNPYDATAQEAAPKRLAHRVLADGLGPFGRLDAALDMLTASRPRIGGLAVGEPLQNGNVDIEQLKAQVARLEDSAPFVQGPARLRQDLDLLTFEEIERLARIFVGDHGVSKIRLTGGEPLVRREVERLVERLARIPGLGDLAMTTNGSALARKAQALGDAGLRRITVSLDGLDNEVFAA